MRSQSGNRVLMVGLDAAELELIERWVDDGSLPHLRALSERSAFCRLASTADWLVASQWATFYTGIAPEEHGLNHYLIWRPETMASERPAPDWFPLPRFWHDVARAGRRAIVVNVPMTYAPEPFDGMEISGFATHESLMPAASHPREILDWVHRSFAAPVPDHEEGRLLSANEPAGIRERVVGATAVVTEVGVRLMREQPWDLFLLCFSATHRAGHVLWDSSSLREPSADADNRMTEAMRDVYVACDTGLGRLLAEAGPDAHVLVFSLHGMGPNTSRNSVLPEMLERVLARGQRAVEAPPRKRLLQQARDLVPNEWRAWVKGQLPMLVQDRLTIYWRTGGIDWGATRAFVPFCDLEGFIRINLRGREASGIVAPGDEYEHLLTEIADGLQSFIDEDTGEPVVAEIGRRDEIFPEGQRRDLLPDLIVRWSSRPAAGHRRLMSPKHGALAWPTPGHVPSGRSGHHRSTGFLFAAGDRVAGRSRIGDGHILDLAPTVFSLLDLDVPGVMPGHSLL